MIDTSRKYSRREASLLEQQGYEFIEIVTVGGERYHVVTGLKPESQEEQVTFAWFESESPRG